jgi:hypothetical protein
MKITLSKTTDGRRYYVTALAAKKQYMGWTHQQPAAKGRFVQQMQFLQNHFQERQLW